MRNRVRVMCKPGSVGDLGGQPPRSTRPNCFSGSSSSPPFGRSAPAAIRHLYGSRACVRAFPGGRGQTRPVRSGPIPSRSGRSVPPVGVARPAPPGRRPWVRVPPGPNTPFDSCLATGGVWFGNPSEVSSRVADPVESEQRCRSGVPARRRRAVRPERPTCLKARSTRRES